MEEEGKGGKWSGRGVEGGSSSFAPGRKKEKSAPMPADDVVMAELVPICSIITR